MRTCLSIAVVLIFLASSVGITLSFDDSDAYDDVFMLYDTLSDEEKDAYDRLYETVVNYGDYCEFSNLFENTGKVYYALASDHPELFWFWISYGWWWWTNGVSYIKLDDVVLDKEENDAKMAEVEKAASKLVFNGSDYEKIKQIHDYLAMNILYQYAENNQNLYGAIIDGRCVCAGYAQAFDYLCKINGIDCIVLRHQAENPSDSHLWNSVRLDGKWYQIDVTWDSSNNDVVYRYFLVGLDSDFIAGHGELEFDFGLDYSEQKYDYPRSTSAPRDLIYLGHDWIDRNKGKVHELSVDLLKFSIDQDSWGKILRAMESAGAYHLSISASVDEDTSKAIRECNIDICLDGVPLDVQAFDLDGKILFSLGTKKTLYDDDGSVISDKASYSHSGVYRIGDVKKPDVSPDKSDDGNGEMITYVAIIAAVLICLLVAAIVISKKRKGAQ